MVVTLVLTATLAPVGWLIQKYWIHGSGKKEPEHHRSAQTHKLIQENFRPLIRQRSIKSRIGRT